MSDTDDREHAPQGGGEPRDTGVTLQRPVIIAILYLVNVFIGFSVIVGVILAYVWRGDREAQEWEKTHYTYLIRTFWIGLVLFVVTMTVWFGTFFSQLPPPGAQGGQPPLGFFITFFGIFGVWAAMAAWYCARCILSLIRAGRREAMPRPETWLF